jgi:Tfp pilus assembly protein PilF
VQLGVSHLASQRADAARSLWRSALTSCWFPTEQGRDLLVRLGDLARKDGDVEAASCDFEAALRLSPEEPSVLNRLGAVRIEQRRFDEALPLLEAAAKAGIALAHTNLGICHFQRGDSARALEHFALAAQQLPNDPTAQANYAMARAASAR